MGRIRPAPTNKPVCCWSKGFVMAWGFLVRAAPVPMGLPTTVQRLLGLQRQCPGVWSSSGRCSSCAAATPCVAPVIHAPKTSCRPAIDEDGLALRCDTDAGVCVASPRPRFLHWDCPVGPRRSMVARVVRTASLQNRAACVGDAGRSARIASTRALLPTAGCVDKARMHRHVRAEGDA